VNHAALVFRFMLRKLLRGWGRIVVLVVLSALAIVIAIVLRAGDSGVTPEEGAAFLVWYGLSIVLPFGALLIASEAFGDLRDERTLVYLWLRPMRPWSATGGAAGASLAVVVVLLVVPLIVAGLILDVEVATGALLAAFAYVGVFLAFGMILSRPLLTGLIMLLVWENVIGALSAATARLTIRSYAASLVVEEGWDVGTPVGRSFAASIAVPLAVGAAGLLLTARGWRRAEVP
jgi:ABC-2 type transport system permease protein